MTTLPEAAIGSDEPTLPLLQRVRAVAGGRLSYALADQVVYSFGNMVVAALLARHAGASEFGTYILTQRAMDVLIQLSNVFLWAPFTFNLPGKEVGRARVYLGSLVAQQTLSCMLAALLLWALGAWSHAPAHTMYQGVFAPLAVTSIAILFREFTRRMYFAQMRFRTAFWAEIATVGLQVIGVEWIWLHHRLDVPHTLWVLSAGAGAVCLYWLVTEWRAFAIEMRAIAQDMRSNLHLGRWLLGGNMVFMVSSQCNPWVLGVFLGTASVGAYSICESVVNIPRVALVSLQNTMAPMMARAFLDGGKPALRRMVTKFNRMILIGAVLFAAAIIVGGPAAARLIYKHVPQDSKVILILLALNFVAFAATLAQSYGLTAMDKPQWAFYANVAGLLAQVSVTVWLVRAMQIQGAALALLVGSVVVLIVRQIFYTQEMKTA